MAPTVKYDNATIRFFLDFTMQVQKQRHSFPEVKKALRDKGYKYSMLFLAKLRVIGDDKVLFFNRMEEVWDWLEQRPQRTCKNPSQNLHQGKGKIMTFMASLSGGRR